MDDTTRKVLREETGPRRSAFYYAQMYARKSLKGHIFSLYLTTLGRFLILGFKKTTGIELQLISIITLRNREL